MRDYTAQPVPDSVWKNPYHFVAFGFGSGAIPFAPGTFGTLMAIPFYLAMQSLSHTMYFFLLIVITLGSMWLCDKVSKETSTHDHSGMCLDEIVGYLVTMFAAPKGFLWILVGFGLFRFFDILKPWPIGYVDIHVKGGVGMILDDVLAGVYSMAILYLLSWLF
jgi:phosphatidylglycerophosphatase A